MTDEFHRPTYTTPKTDVHGAFNASQVRLYGIPGLSNKKKGKFADVMTYIYEKCLLIGTNVTDDQTESKKLKRIRQFIEKNAEPSDSSYVFINTILKHYMVMFGSVDIAPKEEKQRMTSGIIFGYAYEGHSYDLPKPKIMMIPAAPEEIFPPDDSGYYPKAGAGYAVWIVDKLNQCVEIEVNQGFIEQVVLEANLPGKRAPTMYAGKMMMGHRSGRLSE
jgi:hypothetical protein